MSSFNQCEYLNVEPKNWRNNPDLLQETELNFQRDDLSPLGLEEFSKNISSSMGPALILSAGGMLGPACHLRYKLYEAQRSNVYVNNHIQPALQNPDLFQQTPDMVALNFHGQTFMEPFLQVTSEDMESRILSALAFQATFNNIAPDIFENWFRICGLKTQSRDNARFAVNTMSQLAYAPDLEICLTDNSNPNFDIDPRSAVIERWRRQGHVFTNKDPQQMINGVDGRRIPALSASLTDDGKAVFSSFRDIFERYEDNFARFAQVPGLAEIMATDLRSGQPYGVHSIRNGLISSALNVYNQVSAL